MPWSYPGNVPTVARNWTDDEQRRCVAAANAVLERGGSDEEAIRACIAAAEKGVWEMEQKIYRAPIQFKADSDQSGEFIAEFATLNVIDRDQDVTPPGAFTDGQETIIEAWNHNYGLLPVGKGIIRERGNKAVVEGRFFLDTAGGLEHYKVVKALGPLQEWSYSFRIQHSDVGQFEGQQVRFLRKLDVYGVAPVQRGAGIETRTVAIKGEKRALAGHSTETTDAAWDGPANEARVRSGEDEAYYRRVYAWRDPDGDPTVKASYRFIHHMVGGGGEPGAANVHGCITGIAVLNGARGGTTIPADDRQGVWNHLARHLRDAEVEPPELKAATPKALEALRTYLSQFESASGDSGEAKDEAVTDEASDGKSGGKSSGKPSVLSARISLDIAEYCD